MIFLWGFMNIVDRRLVVKAHELNCCDSDWMCFDMERDTGMSE